MFCRGNLQEEVSYWHSHISNMHVCRTKSKGSGCLPSFLHHSRLFLLHKAHSGTYLLLKKKINFILN